MKGCIVPNFLNDKLKLLIEEVKKLIDNSSDYEDIKLVFEKIEVNELFKNMDIIDQAYIYGYVNGSFRERF